MDKIKAYVSWNDVEKIHFYEYFNLLDELPNEYKELKRISLDSENNDDVWKYDFYELTLYDDSKENICVLNDSYKFDDYLETNCILIDFDLLENSDIQVFKEKDKDVYYWYDHSSILEINMKKRSLDEINSLISKY